MRLITATIDGLASAHHFVDQLNDKAAQLEADGYTVLGYDFSAVTRNYANQFEGVVFIKVEPPLYPQENAAVIDEEAHVPIDFAQTRGRIMAASAEPTPIAAAKSRQTTKKPSAA